MNCWSVLFVFASAVGLIEAVTIPYDKVEPFKELVPKTVSDKAAVRFKPSLLVSSGCNPYPAVNAAGETSSGLRVFGYMNESCRGMPRGSQIYARSMWFETLWAIMYVWYFPKNMAADEGMERIGTTHDWANLIVWLDNPGIPNPKIVAVAPDVEDGSYLILHPPPANVMDGDTTKVEYLINPAHYNLHIVDTTTKPGGVFQDLITWDQMSDEVRVALNSTDFGYDALFPFIDQYFRIRLRTAYPIK